jgi:hypothetical protein
MKSKFRFFPFAFLLLIIPYFNIGFSQTKVDLLKKCEMDYDLNDYKSLLIHCNQYLALDTMNARVYSLKGLATLNDSIALLNFRKAISLDSKDFLTKAYILRLTGQTDLFWLDDKTYIEGIKCDTNNHYGYLELAQKMQWDYAGKLNNNIIADSIYNLLNKAIQLRPKHFESLVARGELSLSTDNNKLAIEDFSAALKLKPNDLSAIQGRAYAYYYNKQYANAIPDLNKIIEARVKENVPPDFDFNLTEYYMMRGNCYGKSGNRTQALIDLNRALYLQSSYILHTTRHQWGRNENGCIHKWGLILDNQSTIDINRITFKLVISDSEDEVLFRKSFTLSVKLMPGDVVPTSFFNLGGELCYSDLEWENFDFDFVLEKIE